MAPNPSQPSGAARSDAETDDRTDPGVPLIDRESLAVRAELERRHWWFRGRDLVLGAVLDRHAPALPGRILDAGCGTGSRAARLASRGEVTAIDVNPAAVEAARARGIEHVHRATVERLEFADASFGLVTCLDVIEHVADDAGALSELRRVSRSGAVLLLTAPAYPRLFSGHDVAAGHRRRYTRAGLRSRAQDAGWRPRFETHFNSVLLPLAAASRIAGSRRSASREPRSDLLRTPPALDPLLLAPLRLEAALIRRGAALPAGLSLLLVLRAE